MKVFRTTKSYKGDEAAEWAEVCSVAYASDDDWIAAHCRHLQLHAVTITANELILLRDRQSHIALTAVRLTALNEIVPIEAWPAWDYPDFDAALAEHSPPPLSSARTSTAPPQPPVLIFRVE